MAGVRQDLGQIWRSERGQKVSNLGLQTFYYPRQQRACRIVQYRTYDNRLHRGRRVIGYGTRVNGKQAVQEY